MSTTDRGDDTQRRYRYQAAYAALLSVGLLDENSEYAEVLCEQHEDILLKRKDGKFVGVQVKTRDSSLGPFRFNDPAIMKSLERFINTERQFPNKFMRYVLCSNCGFWKQRRDTSNLVYCLESLRTNRDSTSLLDSSSFLKRIVELSNVSGCSEDFVMDVLRKVWTEQWSDLQRYELVLTCEIATITRNENQRHNTLKKAADQLIGRTFNAAALSHSSTKASYFTLLENPENAATDSIIQNKRITVDIVKKILDECLTPITMLQTLKPINVLDLPKGMNIMELKMAKGGISLRNIDLEKDLKYSAEMLLLEWLHKYGGTEADLRYRHLSVIVKSECLEAYDLEKTNTEPFGDKMLNTVRNRLHQRYDTIHLNFSDCLYEHLMGIAGILTEECTVWWSEEFEIRGEVIP